MGPCRGMEVKIKEGCMAGKVSLFAFSDTLCNERYIRVCNNVHVENEIMEDEQCQLPKFC